MIKCLEKLLERTGKMALEIFDPIDLKINLPLTNHSKEKVMVNLKNIMSSLQNPLYRNLGDLYSSKSFDFSNLPPQFKNLSIAGRMFDHDLRNQWGITITCSDKDFISTNLDDFNDNQILGLFLSSLLHTRLTMLGMAYLGTEDKRFLTYLPIDRLEGLLSGILNKNIPVVHKEFSDKKIRNDWYICLYQLVKNSLKQGFNLDTPEILIDSTLMQSDSKDLYNVIHVYDNANGLADNNGNPLSKDKLEAFFREYSTRGSGLGGQIIAAYLDLAKKKSHTKCDIDIIFKTNNSDYTYFRRGSRNYAMGLQEIEQLECNGDFIRPIIPKIPHGSLFRLIVPSAKKNSRRSA